MTWPRQLGTDIDELTNAHLAYQVTDRANQETPVGAGSVDDMRGKGANLLTDLTISRIIILLPSQ